MMRPGKECRNARRDLPRRNELDAVSRGLLDVHLRRCQACSEISEQFLAIENVSFEIDELSVAHQRRLYNQLLPAVHEITDKTIRPKNPRSVWLTRSTFALGTGFAAAIAILIVGLVRMIPDNAAGHEQAPEDSVLVASEEVIHGGLVDRCEGQVRIDGKNVAVRDGRFSVKTGTQIEIDEGARFSFRIGNLARIALSGDTKWELTTTTDTFIGIRLDRGRLAVEFDGSQGKLLEVTTPDSLVRVKGTVFTVEALDNNETRVGVLEGLVEVLPRRGSFGTVEVGKDQLIKMPGDGMTVTLTEDQRALAVELQHMGEYPEELTRLVRFGGSPEKIKVEVEGRVLGTTPLTVRLPDGPFTYRLTSPGMKPVSGSVVDRDGPKVVAYNLQPAPDYAPVSISDVKQVSPRRLARRAKASSRRSGREVWDLFTRARAAMTAGDIPYAIGLLERAIENASDEKKTNGIAMLAECYSAVGYYSKAADTFELIVAAAPNSATAQNARYEVGRLSMDQLGDLARARASFTAYLASPAGGGLKEEAYYSLCELNGREGAHREALHCFNEFLRAFPGGHHDPDARLWRGALYQDVKNRWADAERDLLSFIRARPRHPRTDEARYRVAIGRYQAHDKRGSNRMIVEYLREHPNGQYRLRVERLRRAILDPDFSWELDKK
jgi:TolA-binding protein